MSYDKQKVVLHDGSEFIIEKNIQVSVRRSMRKWLTLAEQLEPMDSLIMKKSEAVSFQSAAKKHGYKITYRIIDRNTDKVRAWLVEKPEK